MWVAERELGARQHCVLSFVDAEKEDLGPSGGHRQVRPEGAGHERDPCDWEIGRDLPVGLSLRLALN